MFQVFLVYQGRKVIKVSKATQDHQDLVVPQVHQGCRASKETRGFLGGQDRQDLQG